MTNDDALRAAADEGLTLPPAREGSSTRFRGVYKVGNGPRSFVAKVHDASKVTGRRRFSLGCFKCAEEAALEVARFYKRRDRAIANK